MEVELEWLKVNDEDWRSCTLETVTLSASVDGYWEVMNNETGDLIAHGRERYMSDAISAAEAWYLDWIRQ